MERYDLTADLAGRLVAEQFPDLAGRSVRPVGRDGFDNATFRLGDDLAIRLPRHDDLVGQVAKEHRWLPVIATHLPVAIPEPVRRGRPMSVLDRPWSILRWVNGTPLGATTTTESPRELGSELATVLTVLQQVPTEGGPAPGVHNYHRGGTLDHFDHDARATIRRLEGRMDTDALTAVWDAGLASRHEGRSVWVHGDVTGSNLLVDDHGHLCGVIDFGCCAVGDPACDLAPAWTNLDGPSRDRFIDTLDVDAATWARARAWTLWKAIKHLPDLPADHPRNNGHRLGWRWPAVEVLDRLVADAHP